MKFTFNHRWLRPDKRLTAQVKAKIQKLAGLVRIETAQVTLERRSASSPPFLVKVHLAVPGPDLYAEEKDYTAEASVRKALARLARQIRHRKQKLLARRRVGAEECRPWNKSHQPLVFQPG